MVEGQLACRQCSVAVLARILVPSVNVGTREGDVVEPALDADVSEQANDGRQAKAERDPADFAVVDRDDFNLPLAPQGDGLLPVHHLERFVGSVEEERVLHSRTYCDRRQPGCQRSRRCKPLLRRCLGRTTPAAGQVQPQRAVRVSLAAVLVLLAALSLAACATTGAVRRPSPGRPGPPPADAGGVPATAVSGASTSATADALIDAAESLLGAPYINGGTDPAGFDCSGFVQYVFAKAGIVLPRSVREQWQAGEPVDRAEVKRGDLLFFAIDGRDVSHVGIAIDAGAFVHAPSTRGVVRVESLSGDYWSRRFAGARRITESPPPTRGDAGGAQSAAWRATGTAATRDRRP